MSPVSGTRQTRNVESNHSGHQHHGRQVAQRSAASRFGRGRQPGQGRRDGHCSDHDNNKDGDANHGDDGNGGNDDEDKSEDGDESRGEEEDEAEEDEDDYDDDDDEDEDGAGDGEDDEDDSPFKFLERLDPNWLNRRPTSSATLPEVSDHRGDGDIRTPTTGAEDAEFYGAMIQMLTHVLGSSDTFSWPNQATPASQLAPSPFGQAYSSPAQTPNPAPGSLSLFSRSGAKSNRSELSALQPLIQALIARLGKDQQLPRRPVGEQDLTALLQTLMEQQQRQQEQHVHKHNASDPPADAYAANSQALVQSSPLAHVSSSKSSHHLDGNVPDSAVAHNAYQALHFADLDFEDEDEDDPDFNPDLNPDLPLPSAWSLAVRDVVASERSRAAAAAVAASHSGTPSGAQTPADARQQDSYRAKQLQSSGGQPQMLPSLRGTEAHHASVKEQAAQPYRRASLAYPSSRMHASAVAPGDTVNSGVGESASIQAAGTASSAAAPVDRRATSDALFSPSSRSVRASRQRQGSPSLDPQNTRMSADDAGLMITVPVPHEMEAEASKPRKRGRKPILEPGEAQRRRAQRNIEYQRMRRQVKKVEETEQSETVLELKAEVKMLRAELERLRDENAMLRAQRELDRLQRCSQR